MSLGLEWKLDVQERKKKDGLLPMVGIMKIDLAKSRGVVGQRKNVLRSDWEKEYAKGQS